MSEMDKIQMLNVLSGAKVTKFSDLIGATLYKVVVTEDELRLHLTETHYVRFHHDQDCCETVYIESVVGDIEDLVGSEILVAEEVAYDEPALDNWDESYTWTFYKFATIKGSVDIRWYGTSNGYYSESVSVEIVDKDYDIVLHCVLH